MEKRTPHCRLSIVRALLDSGRVRATFSALSGGEALGLDFDSIVAIVRDLTPRDFFKSMTAQSDHTIWQDVYRPSTPAGKVYVKLTVIEEVLIISFKEL